MKNDNIFGIPDPGGSTMNIIKVICENNAGPVLKTYEILRMREITWSV